MPIKYNDITKLPNGAQFYTADLHVHTFGASHDVKDTSMTVEAVIDQAVKSGIGILAITDHNTAKNAERILDYAQKYAGQLLVLAGVEVSTASGHLLVYFAPDAVEKLNSFIGKINIVKSGTSESHTAMSMADVATEARLLGGVCIAAHIDRDKTGFEMLSDGYPNWKKDIVTSPGILGVEVDDAAHLNWYSADDDASPQGAERKKLIDQRGKVAGAAARAVLAHVQNSDAHHLQGFIDAHKKRLLTRLKMDSLSFDGFRTALADPEARVRAAVQLPPTVPRILGVHVQGGFLHAETYRFSDNLTGFIGGRGTGKSTALKCAAHALGVDCDLAEYDNCPDTVVVYCRDGQGITYRYERMKGSEAPTVQACEEGKVIDAPADVFPIEYYGQGDLARVAEDPLAKPHLFQEFLDRHAQLHDLAVREEELLAQLEQNGSSLRPLETQESTRAKKDAELKACDRKLELAERGQLKDIAASQAAVGAEKSLAKTFGAMRNSYARGISLKDFLRDYDAAIKGAGATTGEAMSEQHFASIKSIISDTNQALKQYEADITKSLAAAAAKLEAELKGLASVHATLDQTIGEKVAALQKQGLAASLAEHDKVVKRRGVLAGQIAALDQSLPELERGRKERGDLLAELNQVREERANRRKDQIREINKHLAKVIDDYTVVVVPDSRGLVADYLGYIKRVMQGTYLQDDVVRRLCEATTPQELAERVKARDVASIIAKLNDVGAEWATKLEERLNRLEILHELEVLSKPARPDIKVMTKGGKSRRIPVNQLSDGQRHTILLTIAMLAESEVPLIIDQPEDDLDNAFIFSSIVRMLREVKERRQVILVTHNANIAVLGDAELLFPMRRSANGGGVAFDFGSVDRPETKAAVQAILEGGELAFLRRKEIYGH